LSDQSYQRELKRCQMFSREEEQSLWLRRRTDKGARKLLIESMLRYVVLWVGQWIAKRGISDRRLFDDLLGEANLTLIDVVDNHFDPAKGRLGTILVYYLRRCMNHYVMRQGVVKIPSYYIGKGRRKWQYQDCADAAMRPAKQLIVGVLSTKSCDLSTNEQVQAKDAQREVRRQWIRKTLTSMENVSCQNKEIFFSHLFGCLSYKDLGRMYGISVFRVSTVIRQLMQRLREQYLLEQGDKQDVAS